MLERLIAELGQWGWIAVGLFLLALEVAIPGVFLLWFGLAAIATGTLALMFGSTGYFGWEAQVVLFLILSVIFAVKGKVWMDKSSESDQPLLNQRDAQLIGRTATLEQPISEGFGRIRLDDTQWRVKGPDLPVGARVRVVSVDNGELNVQAA